MIVTFSKLWLLVVVFVTLLYQDGLRGNGVLGRRYEPISEETEQVDKSCSEEIIDSASKTENRSANDAADSGGTSEGPYSEKSRNFPVQSNRKKKDFDDGAKKVDNGYEDNDSCETTHYDDEDDVKLKANQGVRNKISINNNRRDKEVTRNKRYKENEEEVDVSYNEKQSAGKKSIKYKNTANGLHKISNNDDDDIDEGNYKSGVKTTLNQRTSKNENYAKTIQGFDWNKNKHSKRFHSEEDENEYEEKGNSEENNEVDNESKEEEEPKFTIIKGNSKDIALFLNKGTYSIW